VQFWKLKNNYKSTCEDVTCDFKNLYVLYSDIESEWFSETFIVPVLEIRCHETDSKTTVETKSLLVSVT
jgi:hypothetical protein